MAVDDIVMRSARNGYLVLILVLLVLSIYQFLTGGGFLAGGLWVVGVAVFYASKYYYRRQEGAEESEGVEEPGEPGEPEQPSAPDADG